MQRVSIAAAAILVLALTPAKAEPGISGCGLMQMLAQEHANDMARRGSMDHAGFMSRASRGARAENVAMGYSSRAKIMALWRASPGHAANMRLPGCKGVAYARSRSGEYYWAMEIAK